MSRNGDSSAHFLLLVSAGVLSFSELFFIREPHDVTVMRRDAVVLDCQAHGEAPIGIRWLKNGVTLTESERVYLLTNGSLFISEVESRKDKSDEGFYQCLAQNKYGSILSQKARLTIASKLLCRFMYVPVLLKSRTERKQTCNTSCVELQIACDHIRFSKKPFLNPDPLKRFLI